MHLSIKHLCIDCVLIVAMNFTLSLQEMIVQPPLTGIQTPRKDDGSRFPFPGSAKVG